MKRFALASFTIIVCCLTTLAPWLPLQAAEIENVFEAHPVTQLFQDESESWDEFVSRSGRVMRDYTNKTGFEAGGWLCANPRNGQGAMSVISNHSQISVSASIKGCPLGGYVPTSEFMHSHPVKDNIVLTEHDLHGYPVGKVARLLNGMRAGSSVHVGASGGRFSRADLDIGPGYLVHGDNLHYQKNGRQHLARSLREDTAAPTQQRLAAQIANDENRMATVTGVQSRPQAF